MARALLPVSKNERLLASLGQACADLEKHLVFDATPRLLVWSCHALRGVVGLVIGLSVVCPDGETKAAITSAFRRLKSALEWISLLMTTLAGKRRYPVAVGLIADAGLLLWLGGTAASRARMYGLDGSIFGSYLGGCFLDRHCQDVFERE